MWSYNYSNELYHHGIKGQKWGVRHDQKSNNSSHGKKKHLTDKQKKIIAVGAVAAAAALTAYGAYKISNSREFDKVIDVGKNFYRQGNKNEAFEGLNELVYATFKKSDKKKYENHPSLLSATSYTIGASKPIKIAGARTGRKIFKELVANDNDFASRYGHQSYDDFNGGLGLANPMLIKSNMKLEDTYMNPFIKELKKRGYDAVMDTQDSFAKMPVILLNTDDQFKIKTGK